MGNLIYILFVSLSAPLLMMMLLVEKKARLPIIFVLVGIFIAVFAAELNGMLYTTLEMDIMRVSTALSPITEELLKAVPILFFAIIISDKREMLFTASMALGIGFAIMENAYYTVSNFDSFSFLSALIRGFGTGLMHGMCTLLVGFGVSFARSKRKFFAVGTFALLSTAVIYHAIFNMLIQSKYSIIGALLPIATYIPFLIWRYLPKNKDNKTKVKQAVG